MTTKQNKRDAIVASRVQRTAKTCGVSTSEVYKVIRDDRNNEVVMTVYMTAKELEAEMENKLLTLVKELVPFDKEYKSATQQKQNSNCKPCKQMIA